MKNKVTLVLVCVTLCAAIAISFGELWAAASAEQPSGSTSSQSQPQSRECLKIGVVSVRKVFRDSKRYASYRQTALAERDKLEAELDRLAKEIDLDKAGLKTLKAGTSDHLAMMKGMFEKQGKLQAQQEYFKQQMSMKEQSLVEQLFKDVLQITSEVAKEKGLDLVLESSEPELPAASANELTLTISTHKVLFNSGCEDITTSVLAKLDASEK